MRTTVDVSKGNLSSFKFYEEECRIHLFSSGSTIFGEFSLSLCHVIVLSICEAVKMTPLIKGAEICHFASLARNVVLDISKLCPSPPFK